MLKKYIIIFLIFLVTSSAINSSENRSTNANDTINPCYGGYTPGGLNEGIMNFSCQFPLSLKVLLETSSFKEGHYSGGVFKTIDNNNNSVLVKLLPEFFKELTTVLQRTTLILDNGDVTNINYDKDNFDESDTMIYREGPPYKTLKSEDIDTNNNLLIKKVDSLDSLIDLFQSTKLIKIREEKNSKGNTCFFDDSYHSDFTNCRDGTIDGMFSERGNDYGYGLGNSRDRRMMSNISQDRTGLYNRIYFSQCLFLQISIILSNDKEYKYHSFYKNNKKEADLNSSTLKKVKQISTATIATAGLITVTYLLLWYTGRGENMPFMKQISPLFEQVSLKFFKPVANHLSKLFTSTVVTDHEQIIPPNGQNLIIKVPELAML